jgi:molybdopterin adenylyltransferase
MRGRQTSGRTSPLKRLRFVVVTVSTSKYRRKSRDEEVDDESGDVAEAVLKGGGHYVAERVLVSDDPPMVKRCVEDFLSSPNHVIIFVGGTGVSPDDLTIETVGPFVQKELEGFGELFRMLSYDKIGTPAILTRSMAGVAAGRLIVCLPGSPDGVKTALEHSLEQFPEVISSAKT